MFTMFILMMSVALLFGAAILIDSKYFLPKRTKAIFEEDENLQSSN